MKKYTVSRVEVDDKCTLCDLKAEYMAIYEDENYPLCVLHAISNMIRPFRNDMRAARQYIRYERFTR